jgi:D-erythro-7,8-dihydroneopterin triphosphate epimerase
MSYKMSPAVTKITNLRLSAIIGCNDWERYQKQEVLINVTMEFNAADAVDSDDLADTLDYRKVKKQIMSTVEKSSFNLLEKLTSHILGIVMGQPRVERASVSVDKPGALRYADSVSITLSATKLP